MLHKLWRSFIVTIAFSFTAEIALSATQDHALPNDQETQIVQVSDPDDFFSQPFPLLLTNNTGYKIQCSDSNTLISMLEGFGLNANAIAFIPHLSIYSSEVVNSNYEENPVLNCERGGEELYVVTYPDGEDKFFIGFDSGSTALNMIGCQGVLDVMGFDRNAATPISYILASQFFDTSDARDIHCMAGIAPGAENCGDHLDGSIWNTPIENGVQSSICIDGTTIFHGDPVCNTNFEAVGSSCIAKSCGNHPHNSNWSDTILNGSQNYTCTFGSAQPLGGPICNNTHEPDSTGPGGNCMPKNCGNNLHGESWSEAITNGSQSYSCNFGEVITVEAPTCNSDSVIVGSSCIKKKCGTHDNGSYWNVGIPHGSQGYFCEVGTEVLIGSPACDTHYHASGNSCVSSPYSYEEITSIKNTACSTLRDDYLSHKLYIYDYVFYSYTSIKADTWHSNTCNLANYSGNSFDISVDFYATSSDQIASGNYVKYKSNILCNEIGHQWECSHTYTDLHWDTEETVTEEFYNGDIKTKYTHTTTFPDSTLESYLTKVKSAANAVR